MQESSTKALRILNLLSERKDKEVRLTELLKDPESDASPGWRFHVPTCFNDALDIRQTQRKVDGKPVLVWTQGANFAFGPSDVLYDTPHGYQQWSDAVQELSLCIQIKAAVARTVTFDVLRPTENRRSLAVASSHSLSQEAFVRFLITGEGLAPEQL